MGRRIQGRYVLKSRFSTVYSRKITAPRVDEMSSDIRQTLTNCRTRAVRQTTLHNIHSSAKLSSQRRVVRRPMKTNDVLRRSTASCHRYSPHLVKINNTRIRRIVKPFSRATYPLRHLADSGDITTPEKCLSLKLKKDLSQNSVRQSFAR